MERAVRQHRADFAATRRDRGGEIANVTLRHQHHRTDRIPQHRLVLQVKDRCATERAEARLQRKHDGEGFVGSRFSRPQYGNRSAIRGVTEEVIATGSLDGDDLTGSQRSDSRLKRVRADLHWLSRYSEFKARPALRTTDRLSMKTSVVHIGVFGGAL